MESTFVAPSSVGFFASSTFKTSSLGFFGANQLKVDSKNNAVQRSFDVQAAVRSVTDAIPGRLFNPSSSPKAGDNRMFKVTFCVPQTSSRLEAKRELHNVYTTKMIPFSNWYKEQQRIMKAGGKIFNVELVAGKKGISTGLQ